MNKYDVIIIGAGPAGLSAAIYARRANLSVLIIEEALDGGKLSKINSIENYPGFSSISGFELYNNMLTQAKEYKTNFVSASALKIENNTVIASNNETYEFKSLIIATGSKQRKLDIPKALEFTGKGISYCATCDGFFFKNKDVAVIAENNNALEESLYLANLVSQLTIITKKDHLLGEQTLIEKIQNTSNIKILYNNIPTNLIINDNKIVGLQTKDINSNQINKIDCLGIFPYISFNPSTDFLDSSLLDDKGYIKVDENMKTTLPNIYAAGDCTNKTLKQIVTACADGAIAATDIIKNIK